MASLIETAILGAAEANARRDIEKPIAIAMANQYNAAAFKAFVEAAGLEFKGKNAGQNGTTVTSLEEAIKAYTSFCQASGKS